MKPDTTSFLNWYGSNRMLAEHVGAALEGCDWVGVPFAGGFSEFTRITARTIAANDLHKHAINCARIMADEITGPIVYRRLRRLLFHPMTLEAAQTFCKWFNEASLYEDAVDKPHAPETWAEAYFVCSWMGRGSTAGTPGEFTQSLPLRWDAQGGGSAKRFFSAVGSLPAWRKIFKRCEFSCMDAFKFIDKIEDKVLRAIDTGGVAHAKRLKLGVYCDPPFSGPGKLYTHKFSDGDQDRLAKAMRRLERNHVRVVMRYYDTPFVRKLYPESRWHYLSLEGRKQTNKSAPEVLICSHAIGISPKV